MTEQITDLWICNNQENYLEIYIHWPIVPKKNSKQIVRWRLMSSQRYLKRHKLLMDIVSGVEWQYNVFPCKVSITSVVWTKRKSDIDNATSSILDLLTDLGIIPDDNRFVVPELKVENIWYRKNHFVTKIVVEPYTKEQLNEPDFIWWKSETETLLHNYEW